MVYGYIKLSGLTERPACWLSFLWLFAFGGHKHPMHVGAIVFCACPLLC